MFLCVARSWLVFTKLVVYGAITVFFFCFLGNVWRGTVGER